MPFCNRALEKAKTEGVGVLKSTDYVLKAPLYDPSKVICIGMNYVDHCTEQNIPVPEEPVVFSKFPSSITEPNGVVVIPSVSEVSWCSVLRMLPHLMHCICIVLLIMIDGCLYACRCSTWVLDAYM